MKLTLEVIEDAIKARISAASDSGELGYRIKSVATYAGEFDDTASLAEVIRGLPGVWVVLDACGKPERKGPDKWRVPVTFAVMVGARSARSAEAARKGVQTAHGYEPGSYRLMEDMLDLFLGQDLGLAMDPLMPGDSVTVYQTRVASQGLSVLGIRLHTHFIRVGRNTREALAAPELKTVNLNYNLAPVDPEKAADATDVVKITLEDA